MIDTNVSVANVFARIVENGVNNFKQVHSLFSYIVIL